jgi:ABC-2 type transport system permease protein
VTDTRPAAEVGAPLATATAPEEAVSAPDEVAGQAERAAARGPKTTRVVAARVSLRQRLVDLWRARELFAFLVRKEIKIKYKNSFLGFLWSMLNPALTLAVFYVIFTFFLPNEIPNFVIYLFSAILLWNLFQTSIISATVSVVGNAGIVKKVAFPREILAFASVGAAVMFLVFQSVVMIGFMLGFWHRPDWPVIWLLPIAVLAIAAFASALSVFLSAVNVYLRDTQHLVEVALMAWFWAVPGIYAFSGRVHNGLASHSLLGIPGSHLIWLYFANPVTPPVMTFQRFFYNVDHPISTVTHKHILHGVLANYPISWYAFSDLAIIGISLLLLFGALVVFGRLEGNFAEEL